MRKFYSFIKRPVVKAVIIAVLTTLESVVCTFMGDPLKIGFLVLFIIISLIYILLLGFYATQEVNDRRIVQEWKKRAKAYEELAASIISICKKNSTDINKCVHTAQTVGKIDLKLWSFGSACQALCSIIYNCVCAFAGGKNYAVEYVKRAENEKQSISGVVLNAFANQNMQHPQIYNICRPLENAGMECYHDIELFNENNSDINTLADKEEIDAVFGYSSKEKRMANKEKYSQYIAIPVFCDGTTMKMIGLLEITSLYGSTLGINKEELKEIANKYFVPYAYMFLLLHKMEKALLVGTENLSTSR